jgi:hypothetical protein
MSPREIIDEINTISSIITSVEITPIQGVQYAYVSLARLRGKLVEDCNKELFAGRDPGYVELSRENGRPEPADGMPSLSLEKLLKLIGRSNLKLTIAPAAD